MLKNRSCGVLLHITSLPSAFGIGDLGPEAYKFADFMLESGLTYWQILPLNPVEGDSGYSPYSGLSAFAGNPMLISPELLMDEGYLEVQDLEHKYNFSESQVEFEKVIQLKKQFLDKAFINFSKNATPRQSGLFKKFCHEQAYWLEDFADYMAIKNFFGSQAWYDWPTDLRDRDKKSLKKFRKELKKEIYKEKFLQFVFFQQWETLKLYCKDRSILFFGDLPFYVGQDSADVWSHTEIFKLDDDKSPKAVAGVPPDYFSETGQLWGMPVFDWKKLKKRNYDWWVDRIDHNLNMFDLIRLDHFRAFSDYWEVPAGEKTAINGSWKKGPGKRFFKKLNKKYPELPIIAEDLGDIDQPVYDLMEQFQLPGMKVLLFAFGEGMAQNAYVPHHHVPNSVVYTGTHDNNTCLGWYSEAAPEEQKNFSKYINRTVNEKNAASHMVRLAMSSVGKLCVIPMQDFLGLGKEAIMNVPSTAQGNWLWRMKPQQADGKQARKIKELLTLYDRHRPNVDPVKMP
ncbi:4-alpha-glucanotransferase [Catalinimonas alkaloidigena]|uniref:4-alpha-glucanotransferase n=1 Tax=Catalinimonas alkaloidigena TaxID=1075417 RepID=UPI002406D35B|nr:4-alpha-glucanotransferase [Catalinimonas alkaloidigena]MDF9797217.1 4-alpha-glucanotransferase [Catalinimonas alkaloidigena]